MRILFRYCTHGLNGVYLATKQYNTNVGYVFLKDDNALFILRTSISESVDYIRGGQRAGPLVLFDSMDNVMVLSAYSEFMAHNMMYNSSDGQVSFGVMGGADSIPDHYQVYLLY